MLNRLLQRKSIDSIQAELREAEQSGSGGALHRTLNLFDLVCFGIAAIVGAGIFSTIGSASSKGGPAVTLLFILTAITCLFSALCYAEFAARIPVSGSAYTYAYAAFGELIAWIIGWDLLMEYAIGNSVIAFSWSGYLSTLLEGIHIGGYQLGIPDWLETDYYSCAKAARENAAGAFDAATATPQQAQLLATWNNAPRLAGWPLILDLPALGINLLVTWLVYIGIKESKTASNAMVILKVCVVLAVIVIGAFYVQPSNWSPFAPHGASGVLQGIAAVFFAYIGFDAISTTAEECKDPQRDLPRATILTLVICTILYVAIALVLTGMVSYSELAVDDPLAFVFQKVNLNWVAGIVSLSAIVAITSVFLVFQIGQPRIWMSMARDGLLPPRFASIHRKYKTPAFSTVVTGIVVALPILFLNQDVVTDLCSIGTLFAFMLVSGGVLMLDDRTSKPSAGPIDSPSTFRVPYINSRWIMTPLWLTYTVLMFGALPENHQIFSSPSVEKLPYAAFYLAFTVLTVYAERRNWSLIPVLGVLTNLYLIAGLGHNNWLRFIYWLLIGLAIYFCYGYSHSKLRSTEVAQ